MKKITYLIGAMALVFCAFSCQKELLEGNSGEAFAEEGTPVTLTVNNNLWTANGKSAVVPGEGVKVLGDEWMALVYTDTDGKTIKGASDGKPIQAKPGNAGKYTFTAPEGSLSQKYVAIVPQMRLGNAFDNVVSKTKEYHTVSAKISPIQFPTATSFDPAADILISEPFSITSTETGAEATINSFKRMTAPLKLKITGLDDADKIYAVSFKVEGQAFVSTSCLATYAMYNIGENFDDVKTYAAKQANTVEGGVSAVYSAGLAKNGSDWPVWLSVAPMQIKSGSALTVTVQTQDRCYTRTVSISAAKQLVTDQINELGFNIKGADFEEKEAIYQDFLAASPSCASSQQACEYTASDGVKYTWNASNVRRYSIGTTENPGVIKPCMEFCAKDGASLQIPQIEGNNINKLRIYLHHNCSIASALLPLDVYEGETKLASYSVAMTTKSSSSVTSWCPYYSAGYVDIALPEGKTTFGGLKLVCSDATYTASNYILISGIAMYLEGDGTEKISLKFSTAVEDSDQGEILWPFSDPAKAPSGSPVSGSAGTEISFKTAAGLTFKVKGTWGYALNKAAGLGFGKTVGDYFEFPVIEGKYLTRVTLEMGYRGACSAKITDADGNVVSGGELRNAGGAKRGGKFVWDLAGTNSTKAYRLYLASAQSLYMRSINLTYSPNSPEGKVVSFAPSDGLACATAMWAFSSPAYADVPGVAPYYSVGIVADFTMKDSGYVFKILGSGTHASAGILKNSTSGLGFGRKAGDYIQFPVIEGYKVAEVYLRSGSTSTKLLPRITCSTDSTSVVSGGESIKSITKGDDYKWQLTGTTATEPYRMSIVGDGETMWMQYFGVRYVPVTE